MGGLASVTGVQCITGADAHCRRAAMLGLMDNATRERPGLPNYIHVNGVDFLIASADTDFQKNAQWVEGLLGRRLTAKESLRSRMVAAFEQPVSDAIGGSDKRFGKSGAVPYIFSSQEAFATVSFIMPLACYRNPAMKAKDLFMDRVMCTGEEPQMVKP